MVIKRPISNTILVPNTKRPKKPRPVSMTGLEGKRSKEAKKVNEREVDPEKRIERLTAIAREHGPERLLNEVEAHERKTRDLRAALERFYEEERAKAESSPDPRIG